MKFRAAVLHEIGKPVAIEQVEVAALGDGDVLVRVGATGLCHTDLEVTQGALQRPLPTILGHEAAGVVEQVGAKVTGVRPGDHVVCSWNPSCGHCFYCDDGHPILCEPVNLNAPRGKLLDGASRLTLDGAPLNHFMMVSSHAEYCVVPEAGAVKVPKEIPFDRACLIGCAVMTGFGAATHIAPVAFGSTAVVIGCGGVGLSAIQGAALRQAARIIAVDLDDHKLASARAFGATDTLNPKRDDVAAVVREKSQGRGADFTFEAAGNEKAMRLAMEVTRPGGEAVLLGKVPVDDDVRFRWGSLMGEKRITRSSYGGARPHRDFPALAQAYLDGRLKLDEMITQRIPLDRINEGYAALAAGQGIRTVVVFDTK
jgi:S-(hydroxymethyl)glutathione dehydrogenase / alcohol dehydrogenase